MRKHVTLTVSRWEAYTEGRYIFLAGMNPGLPQSYAWMHSWPLAPGKVRLPSLLFLDKNHPLLPSQTTITWTEGVVEGMVQQVHATHVINRNICTPMTNVHFKVNKRVARYFKMTDQQALKSSFSAMCPAHPESLIPEKENEPISCFHSAQTSFEVHEVGFKKVSPTASTHTSKRQKRRQWI